MSNWSQIKERGKQRFVWMFSLVLSLALVIDYYIIKFFFNSFEIEIIVTELMIVWIICLSLAFTFALYSWSRLENDWHKK